MLDFTSALYLGFTHASEAPFEGEPLSLGKPVALEEPPGAVELAGALAELIGCQAGVVAPSTLALFFDLPLVVGRSVEYFADVETYPVGRWSLERAAAFGAKVTWFPHHDAGSLERRLTSARSLPVVVTDGFCPACGRSAPLNEYLALVRRAGGILVIDDTQALGIWGSPGSPCSPYGLGGGGSLRRLGLDGPDIVVISSLAKAFGVPVACLTSSLAFVGKFSERSATRVHCSPPSTAVNRAGLRALEWNRVEGDRIRTRLAARVLELRHLLRIGGWLTQPGCFPVQTISHPSVEMFHERLLRQGVRTVLQTGDRLSFMVTASHTQAQLAQVAKALRQSKEGAYYDRFVSK